MNAWNKLLVLVAGLGLYGASAAPAEAQVRIYKVTFNAKARFVPKSEPNGNSFKHTGYLIYQVGNPAASKTVRVLKGKKYQVDGSMRQALSPVLIFLGAVDLSGKGFVDAEIAMQGTQNGGVTYARSHLGKVPRKGFKLGGVVFLDTAKSIAGKGSLVYSGGDHYTLSEMWTLDKLTSAAPATVADGFELVIDQLERKGYEEDSGPL